MNRQNNFPMLLVLYCGAFVAAFNENIINTGLMDIMSEFSVSSSVAQWLVTGYMIVTAVIVTIMAFLLKRFSAKRIFACGATLLVVGSLLCMFAPSFTVLLIARLLTSVGTGLFIPLMMNTVLTLAPKKKLGTYLSIGGCMITFGPALAPVASGFMVTTFGWRSEFLIPAVVVGILLVIGLFVMHPISQPEKIRLDIISVILSAAGLTLFVLGLGQITSNLPIALLAIAAGLGIIIIFVLRQGKLENPLLDLRPMANPLFSVACVLVIVAMMTTFSMSVLLPLYFEGACGTTAFVAGALILIPIMVNAGTTLIGGKVMDRRGEWPLLPLGFLLIALGLGAVCLMGRGIAIVAVVAGSVVVYAGVGAVFSPSQTAGLKHLDHEMNPYGVSIMSTFIQIAACIGPSLFVGILSSTAANGLALGLSSTLAEAAGFSAAVLVATAIGACGLIVSFVYARRARAIQAARQAQHATLQAPVLRSMMMTDVYKVDEGATVYDAMARMVEHHTSGLPVVGARDEVVGFISDGDIMKALSKQDTAAIDLASCLAIYHNDETFESKLRETVELDVMQLASEHVISIDIASSIEDACTLLGERKIKKVPVLSDGKLIGTLSRSDVTRYFMTSIVERGTNVLESQVPQRSTS